MRKNIPIYADTNYWYQESADSYNLEHGTPVGTFHNIENINDGDWETSSNYATAFGKYQESWCKYYPTYIIPSTLESLTENYWLVKHEMPGYTGHPLTENLTIPIQCLQKNNNNLELKIEFGTNTFLAGYLYYCFDGSDWVKIGGRTGTNSHQFEEGVFWNGLKPISFWDSIISYLENIWWWILNLII